MFKKNTAITGFPIGNFIRTNNGATVTTGSPTCGRLLDGVGASMSNVATYDTSASMWKIDLTADDMNGDMVGLTFKLASCIPITYSIRTTTKLISELNDITSEQSASSVWTYSGSRWITGGSVIATSGSVVTTNNLDKTNYSLSASGLNEVSVKAASGVWNNTDKIVTGGSVVATSGSVVAITVDDKIGYSIAASGIGNTAISASAINDQSITDAARNEISKNLLKFDLSTITGEASRSTLNALRFLRNKWSVLGSTLTITKENDSDEAWTAELTGNSSACPVTGIDPN